MNYSKVELNFDSDCDFLAVLYNARRGMGIAPFPTLYAGRIGIVDGDISI